MVHFIAKIEILPGNVQGCRGIGTPTRVSTLRIGSDEWVGECVDPALEADRGGASWRHRGGARGH
ncbi:hypothetical protein PSP6_60027 [Paraburkholderia tropica]|nr:hypothetical protein PSP6_60027 [Paraburkholderia tropica]